VKQTVNLGRVALFGARGAIGQTLAPHLSGSTLRVVGRDERALQHDFPDAQVIAADFLSGAGVDAASQEVETVFYLAGADYTHFERHPVMVRNALAGAARAGVRRFVLVTSVYSYAPEKGERIAESHPHVPVSGKGRWRLEQEQEVLSADRPAAMRTLVVHLPDFYGPHADNSLANYFLREAIDGKTATFIGPLDAQREFVYVPDVAVPLLALAGLDDAYGTRWNLGGSLILARDFTNATFDILATRPKVRSISKWMLQLFGIFNPTMRELGEMYYLAEGQVILDDSKLQARIGPWPKTPFREGLVSTIAWMRS
jgi:nucleoside-diphosphate-sugar epimerase